jgi:DNA-binding NarL/FixJ family response regulator
MVNFSTKTKTPAKNHAAGKLSCPKTPGEICAGCKNRLETAAKKFRLTAREIEVLRLSGTGEPVKNIAEKLGVSCRTIIFHREHVCRKTGRATLAAAIFAMLE